jgi:transglutaminase/protease-like cytokinesis protein 3
VRNLNPILLQIPTDHDAEIPYTPHDSPDHAWNAVFVDDDWRFVDCCWGAGYEDESGYWVKKYEEFWFLTDPDKFINDHNQDTGCNCDVNLFSEYKERFFV